MGGPIRGNRWEKAAPIKWQRTLSIRLFVIDVGPAIESVGWDVLRYMVLTHSDRAETLSLPFSFSLLVLLLGVALRAPTSPLIPFGGLAGQRWGGRGGRPPLYIVVVLGCLFGPTWRHTVFSAFFTDGRRRTERGRRGSPSPSNPTRRLTSRTAARL